MEENKSHPAWVCGLKLKRELSYILDGSSHPAWVCGLKPGMENNKQSNTVVTPCVGVWIETVVSLLPMKLIEVTPCVGVWIETGYLDNRERQWRHTLRGCVD